MKKLLAAFVMVVAASTVAMAGAWDSNGCSGCHNGGLAKSKEQLKAEIKSVEEFVKKAKETSNPMMQSAVQGLGANADKVLREAAKEVLGK
jgi:opacity protein-like surface antigen